MARRSTLELLQTLRRRAREAQGRMTAAAAGDAAQADRVLAKARAEHEEARTEKQRGVAPVRERLDAGTATAGALAQAHRYAATAERRIAGLDDAARRAGDRAELAKATAGRASGALERARAAEQAVEKRRTEMATEARARTERRDEEAGTEAWNTGPGRGRSRGSR